VRPRLVEAVYWVMELCSPMLKSREKEAALVFRPPTLITEGLIVCAKEGMDRQRTPNRENRISLILLKKQKPYIKNIFRIRFNRTSVILTIQKFI
jgi:hypothetical protein